MARITIAQVQEEKAQLEAELKKIRQEIAKPKVGGVVEQIRRAMSTSWIATLMGFAVGGIIPILVWYLVHHDLRETWLKGAALLVIGGLVFSAGTVYQWGCLAFANPWKAVAFTVLMEGVLTLAEAHWAQMVALSYLVFINAVGTASILAVQDTEGVR